MTTIDKKYNLETIYIINENDKGFVKVVLNKATNEKCILKYVKNMNPDINLRLFNMQSENNINGIPRIYDVFYTKTGYYLLQEYIIGTTFSEQLLDERIFSDYDVKQYIRKLIQILKILHKQTPPIIHRDIKPSNIMITKEDSIILIDFDASRQLNDESTTDTRLIVTKGFAPPEQYGFSQTDCRSDIYSIGILMYTLLTGNDDENIKSYKGKFKKIILKCTKLDPKQRYPSVIALEKDILKILSLKHSIIKYFKNISLSIFVIFLFLYINNHNIIQNSFDKIMQISKVNNLPIEKDTYIEAVKSLAYDMDKTNYYRYKFGRAFDESTVKWSFWVDDKNRRLVTLDGIMLLNDQNYKTTITFKINDNLDYPEIVYVNSDLFGELTDTEEIDAFVYYVSFSYWDLAYKHSYIYLYQYLQDAVYPNANLVIKENFKQSEINTQNPLNYKVYDDELFLGEYVVDRYTKEIFLLNPSTSDLDLIFNPF